MLASLARLMHERDEDRRTAAFDRANADPDYWNPYLSTASSGEERSERAEMLRLAHGGFKVGDKAHVTERRRPVVPIVAIRKRGR